MCCGFFLKPRPLVINFDENIKNTLDMCVEWAEREKWKEEFEFFYLFRWAIIIDNYLECGWGMKITAVLWFLIVALSFVFIWICLILIKLCIVVCCECKRADPGTANLLVWRKKKNMQNSIKIWWIELFQWLTDIWV